MSSLNRDLVFLILQFLEEEKFKKTVHQLEQESGVFFNIKYFEEEVQNGNWDELEKYLSGFIKVDDNQFNRKIFFEIRKQKYLEVLDKNDRHKALEILVKDLKVFSTYNEEIFKEITLLLTSENIRENEQLSSRAIVLVELKNLIRQNPLLRHKLKFPTLQKSRLRFLINQSLNWQHQFCKNRSPTPDMKNLFVDHSCPLPNDNKPLLGSLPKARGFPPLGTQGPFRPTPSPVPTPLSGGMSSRSSVSHQAVSGAPSIQALKRLRAHPTNSDVEYPSGDSDHVSKRTRTMGISDEVSLGVNMLPMTSPGQARGHTQTFKAPDDLPTQQNGDSRNIAVSSVKPVITEESNDKSNIWKLSEVSEPSQCRSLRLPKKMRVTKISRLIFTNSGKAILALASDAIHLLWKWQQNDSNATGKATASLPPQLWQPKSGILMTNDVDEINPEEAVPCFALSNNDSYVLSASGGKISLFNMLTFKAMTTLMPPPPAATFLALHPQKTNIIAIGMDDSTIQIYDVRIDEIKSKLKGHSKRITGLTFSNELNVLVSSGADAQLCVWETDGWEKQKSKVLQIPQGRSTATLSDTHVQFHQDQVHFLVVHENQLAIYETTMLECIKQWPVPESSAPITHATFSCDSQLIYTSFMDATICVFSSENLRLRCRVNPSAYLPVSLRNSNVHPLVIAAHPQESNMFAVGLSDGGVCIFEPLECEDEWGEAPPPEVTKSEANTYAPSLALASLKHLRTHPTNSGVEYPSGDSDHDSKRTRSMGISDEVSLGVNMLPMTSPGKAHGHTQTFKAPDDLPTTVARTLSQGSSPMSMDFHPIKPTLLLVGTNVGDIGLWEVCSTERLVQKTFKVWDLSKCSMPLPAALEKEPVVSVNRVIWSPDGSLFGVAYSRNVVQIYSYHGGEDMRQHLEIDAHVGGVNDIAFSSPNNQLCVTTCGDDKTIKVWDAANGVKLHTFKGHEAPVYSICPYNKEYIQCIFSTALDGKIKLWLYDDMGSRVTYDAPGRWCTTMAYSADGTRLLSCGTSKDGDSNIVEWDVTEGAVKRYYQGFQKRSLGVVQFDTTKNRYLAAGDDFSIKFWDMDNVQLLTAIDADGGLEACPRIRFNKEGSFLAVSANGNMIKVMANSDGLRLLKLHTLTALRHYAVAERPASVVSIPGMNEDSRNIAVYSVKPVITEESNDKSKIWKLTEVGEPSQCRSLRLPENNSVTKISRLIFTNSGKAILALASDAIHLLWKWQQNDSNATGKATASLPPQLWQPKSGILMTNDVDETNAEEAVPCFALSNNDSYVLSASGGKVSLFNMMSFKKMTTLMPPPPAATFLAFHPQDNNIIAIGMDDGTIQIYHPRAEEVKSTLKGHSKRITGLSFSNELNVLVSSGADAQLCVWNTDGWEMQKSKVLQIPQGRSTAALSDTHVQFHQDQVHFLVVHETQLAIYETTVLECMKQWPVPESSAPITHATFSCDSQLIYTSFMDATICVFSSENLRLLCRVISSAYLPVSLRNSSVHPLVIAAHPQESNMFAVGLSDGGVHIFEPLESEGEWGEAPPPDNG